MLNERQMTLYNYLLNQNGWVNRIDILNDLKDVYGFENNGNLYKNTSAVRLTNDIKHLNNDPDVRKLIIFNSSKGVKIANMDEARDYHIK